MALKLIALALFVIWAIGQILTWVHKRNKSRSNGGFKDYLKNPSLQRQYADSCAERDRIVDELAKHDPDEVVELLLDNADYDIPRRAVEAMGPRALPALHVAVADDRFRARTDSGEQDSLHVMLRRSEPLETALDCLERIADPSTTAVVRDLVTDKNDRIRRTVARLLGSIATVEAADLLVPLIADDDAYVRSAAMSSVGRAAIGARCSEEVSARLFDPILSRLDSGDHHDTSEAPEALLRLDRKRATETLVSARYISADRNGVGSLLHALYEESVCVPLRLLKPVWETLKLAPDPRYSRYPLGNVVRLAGMQSGPEADALLQEASISAIRDVRVAAAEAKLERIGIRNPCERAFKMSVENGHDLVPQPVSVVADVYWLTAEVKNGGLSQFFVNSAGDRWSETMRALRDIGSEHDIGILREAIAKFPHAMPSRDGMERHKQLARIIKRDEDAFAHLDSAFYKDKSDREVLLLEYVFRHQAKFRE